MPYYRALGDLPRKHHTLHPGPDGRHQVEELMGAEGFSGPSSLLYHRHSPSALLAVETVAGADDPARALVPAHPVRPRHVRPRSLEAAGGRQVLFGNADVQLAWEVLPTGPTALWRNAVGDELWFIQSGVAVLESVFGSLAVGPGDYVVIPASTTHRFAVVSPVEALVLEAAGHVGVPERYLTDTGQLREGAPFSERDQRGPTELLTPVDDGPTDVLVRTRAGVSRHTYANHPFDVVGWDGCLYPWAFSVHDFEPIVGRLHQPPPVHQTFAGPRFVVCTFAPRPLDADPQAVKVPYHHANVDSDEVLFYSDGDFLSRAGSGIGVASLTLHPAGFVHGPQPGSLEASMSATRTEEIAVMVDTFGPLHLGPAALACDDEDYPLTWARPR